MTGGRWVVATTRGDGQDRRLREHLEAAGADVVEWPTMTVEPPEDSGPLSRALAELDAFDWVAFTSPRAVAAATSRAPAPPAGPRVVAVGPSTAAAVVDAGWPVTLVGSGGAEALVRAWSEAHDLAEARVLFPAGSLARPTLVRALEAAGARVERVEAYRTRIEAPEAARVRADLERGVDVVTFASPSAVTSLRESLSDAWPAALQGCALVAIGETTRDALVEAGVDAARVTMPAAPGLDALAEAAVATRPLVGSANDEVAP